MKNFPVAIRSMTAYGEASSDDSSSLFQVVIQSVNRRFLEINCNLPRALSSFEIELRKWVSAFIFRGYVNITISMRPIVQQVHIIPNIALAQEIKTAWRALSEELALSSEVPLTLLSQEKDLFFHEYSHERVDITLLEKTIKEALYKHCTMREEEGYTLKKDILGRLDLIIKNLEDIDFLKGEVISKNQEKMRKRALELFATEAEDKVLREVAFLAEKFDITEEIVRFKSLYNEFMSTLRQPLEGQDTKGKKLEFLIQELSREINTISSKSQSFDIAKNVVDIKSELEKIREQIQNIE